MSFVQNNAGSTTGGITGAGFVPGQSGNPAGRPRGLARITRELVADDGRPIAEFWLATMNDPGAKLSERLEASRLLADRGWGKADKGEPTAEEMAPTERSNCSAPSFRTGISQSRRHGSVGVQRASASARPGRQRHRRR